MRGIFASNYASATDTTAPKGTITTIFVSPVSAPILATITFNRAVTGFDITDITVTNCSLSSFNAISANVYTVLATPTTDGTFTLQVQAGKCVDVRGTPNVAGNTLSLTYVSGGFVPSNVNPDLWLDMIYQYSYTTSIDPTNGRIVDTVTSRDANAYISTPLSGVVYRKPSWNGEGFFFNQYSAFTVGTNATFSALHKNNVYTLYYQWKQLPVAQQATAYPIFTTNGITATNANVGVRFSLLNSATSPNTLQYIIFTGTGGTPPFTLVCASNAVDVADSLGQGGINTVKLDFTGTVLTISIKNASHPTYTQIGTLTNLSPALSAANSFAPLQFGSDGSVSGDQEYKRHVIFFFRSVSGADNTSIQNYLSDQESTVITPVSVKVLLGAHLQSNGWGQGENSEAASVLQPPNLLGFFLFKPYGGEVSYNNAEPYWGQTEIRLHGRPPGLATQHGWWARFGYNMAQSGYPLYMIPVCRSSTPLKKSFTNNNWSAQTPYDGFSYFNTTWKQGIRDGLYELIHVQRKIPQLRMWLAWQGESDQGTTSRADYLFEQELLLNTGLDYITGLGYDVSKVRFMDILITSGSQATIAGIAVTNASGDALFTKASHGLTTSQWVMVSGSVDYDGVRYVSVIDANTFNLKLSSTSTNVAYVANRTAGIRIYGDINCAKLDVYEGYFTRNPSRIGTFKGLLYVDASEISSNTHPTAVELDELGTEMATIMLPYINE